MPGPRIVVITSCTGLKTVSHPLQLAQVDFALGSGHVESREAEVAEVIRPAAKLYAGQQHVRLLRHCEPLMRHATRSDFARTPAGRKRSQSQPGIDLWILSAGYGFVPGDRLVAPYECTFKGMSRPALRRWAESLGAPEDFRHLLALKADLILVLLGDTYLEACQPDATISPGSPVLLMCSPAVDRRLPAIPGVRTICLANREARRFSCGLVGLKGELGGRLVAEVASGALPISALLDPDTDVLGALDRSLVA